MTAVKPICSNVYTMNTQHNDWKSYLPDPAEWPPALTEIAQHGEFVRWRQNADWLILLSAKEGDLVPVQDGGAVQARLAINRTTGEIVYPTPGARIREWEAEVMGEGEQYREARERLRNTPVRLEDWGQIRHLKMGKPKEV